MKKILIIEDDLDLVSLLQVLLENNGFKVEGSKDGTLITKVINRFKPHLIVVDYYLNHNKNGEDLCKEVKANFDIPILMVSAMTTKESSCADGFMQKPFEITVFLDKVNKMINDRGQKP